MRYTGDMEKEQLPVHRIIRLARRYAGLTQKELAQKLNVSRETVISWERGERLPLLVNMKKLSRILRLTREQLKRYYEEQ